MGRKTETRGRVTEVPKASRWGDGYSPKELVEITLDEIEDINDIVIISRFIKTADEADSYNVLSSSMAMHELLGFVELGKLMSIQVRSMEPDEEPA